MVILRCIPRPVAETAPVIATGEHAASRGWGPTCLTSVGRRPRSRPAGVWPPRHVGAEGATPGRPPGQGSAWAASPSCAGDGPVAGDGPDAGGHVPGARHHDWVGRRPPRRAVSDTRAHAHGGVPAERREGLWKTIGWAGDGPTPAARPRRGAGPHVARPADRLSGRRRTACNRCLAAWRSRRASARAWARSRMASSATVGTSTGGNSPERRRLASGVASRRAVLTRSPACFGTREGATTPPRRCVRLRARSSQDPQGPASSTTPRGVAFEVRGRIRWSMARWRGPRRPKQTTAASRASRAYATAMDAGCPSSPTDRGRASRRVDLRVRGASCRVRCTRRLWRMVGSPAV
jgi:hypothetical protein